MTKTAAASSIIAAANSSSGVCGGTVGSATRPCALVAAAGLDRRPITTQTKPTMQPRITTPPMPEASNSNPVPRLELAAGSVAGAGSESKRNGELVVVLDGGGADGFAASINGKVGRAVIAPSFAFATKPAVPSEQYGSSIVATSAAV